MQNYLCLDAVVNCANRMICNMPLLRVLFKIDGGLRAKQ